MSNIHGLEPQAQGLIVFKTTFGDIELELFTKQCPKITRNFVQLCLDGYYEGTIFDRVEKDFIAIGGKEPDESQHQADIEFNIAPDEFHSRLKFSRRGLMATANTEKDANGPEFFFTLGPAPELQNKHSIFGRLVGDSVYCLVDLNECPVHDDSMVPISEKKIIQVTVVDNPYPELVRRPDFVKALNRATNRHELKDVKSNEEEEEEHREDDNGYLKPKFDFKNSKKLSFYDEESESEDEDGNNNDDIKTETNFIVPQDEPKQSESETNTTKDSEEQTSTNEVDQNSNEAAREKRLREIREQIRNFKEQLEKGSATKIRTLAERKRLSQEQDVHNVTLESRANSSKQSSIEEADLTAQELRLTTKKGRQRERETLELMDRFKKKLKETSKSAASTSSSVGQNKCDSTKPPMCSDSLDNEDRHLSDALDLVDDDNWMRHKFDAESTVNSSARDSAAKGDDWYSIDDPRDPMNNRKESERARDHKHYSERKGRHRDHEDDHRDRDHRDRDRGHDRHGGSRSRHRNHESSSSSGGYGSRSHGRER